MDSLPVILSSQRFGLALTARHRFRNLLCSAGRAKLFADCRDRMRAGAGPSRDRCRPGEGAKSIAESLAAALSRSGRVGNYLVKILITNDILPYVAHGPSQLA